MSPHSIAVVGSVNEDFIVHEGGKKHSYGGILYNLAALSTLLPEAKIFPVAFLGTNIWPRVGSLSLNLTNVDWGTTIKLKRESNQVTLFYSPSGEKKEILKHPVPAFGWQNLNPALAVDVILLNFISGWEVSPALFKKLRQKFSGLIHVDLHSLLLGMRKHGHRFARVPKGWEVFLDADFVQMNQQEWELVAGVPYNKQNLFRFCRRWQRKRWKAIIVTLAEKGAAAVFREFSQGRSLGHASSTLLPRPSSGQVRTSRDKKPLGYPFGYSVKAPRVRRAEPTGAGDFFAAGFISAILEKESFPPALKRGVQTASWKCRYEGIEAVLKHRKELKRFLTTGSRRTKLPPRSRITEGNRIDTE